VPPARRRKTRCSSARKSAWRCRARHEVANRVRALPRLKRRVVHIGEGDPARDQHRREPPRAVIGNLAAIESEIGMPPAMVEGEGRNRPGGLRGARSQKLGAQKGSSRWMQIGGTSHRFPAAILAEARATERDAAVQTLHSRHRRPPF